MMAADEIGVQVGFDDVLDFHPLPTGFLNVLVHIPLRIHDRCFAIRADQVRSMRQTAEIKLLEVHGPSRRNPSIELDYSPARGKERPPSGRTSLVDELRPMGQTASVHHLMSPST